MEVLGRHKGLRIHQGKQQQLLQLLQYCIGGGQLQVPVPGCSMGCPGCPKIRTCSVQGGAGRCCGHWRVVSARCNMHLNLTTRINPYFCRHLDSPNERGCLETPTAIPNFALIPDDADYTSTPWPG